MQSIVHTEGDCGGEVVPKFATYGRGLPMLDFECELCGRHVGSIADVTIEVSDATVENVEYAGEV